MFSGVAARLTAFVGRSFGEEEATGLFLLIEVFLVMVRGERRSLNREIPGGRPGE
jgi:hypothetical protein